MFLIGAYYIGSFHGRSEQQKKQQLIIQQQKKQLDSLQKVFKQYQAQSVQEIGLLKDSVSRLHEKVEDLGRIKKK